jgi:hypothetical protein
MYFVVGLALVPALWTSMSAADVPAATPSAPFAVAGVAYAEASDFLQRLKRAVRDSDANAVWHLTQFPLTINGKPGPKNALELARQFTEIYTERVRAAVLGQTVDGLFANWPGLIIGHGEVWFSPVYDSDSARGSCKNRRILVIRVNNSVNNSVNGAF